MTPATIVIGSTTKPEARPVRYPLIRNDRATTGALIGPDGRDRDLLLVDLCTEVARAGGQVWCAESWPHAAPPELRALASTQFTALTELDSDTAEGRRRPQLVAKFDILEELITARAVDAATEGLRCSQGEDHVLVVLYEADEILAAGGSQVGRDLLRLVRRGATVGVGFLLVTPTTELHGPDLLRALALDSGACIVLGSMFPDEMRHIAALRRRTHAGWGRLTAKPGQASLILADPTMPAVDFPLRRALPVDSEEAPPARASQPERNQDDQAPH